MKRRDLSSIYLVLGLAGAGSFVYALFLIGGETLRVLALILVAGLTVAAIVSASALPIRAWKKNDAAPVVRHFYHDGTRTVMRERERVLDGRTVEAPRLFQLPAQPQTSAFPELLRAAWQAGQLNASSAEEPSGAKPRQLPSPAHYEFDPDWEGDILG